VLAAVFCTRQLGGDKRKGKRAKKLPASATALLHHRRGAQREGKKRVRESAKKTLDTNQFGT